MNIILSQEEVESRFIATQQCTQEFLSSLRDQIETLTARIQTCCSGSSSSSLPPASSSSSLAPSSSSSSSVPCTFFDIVANVSGTDPHIGGHFGYDIYGSYDTSIPAVTANGTFPWPSTVTPGLLGYAAFENPDPIPGLNAFSYELLYISGCWRLYSVTNSTHGNTVLEVGVSASLPFSEQPPVGVMAMTYISGYNLTLEILHNYCMTPGCDYESITSIDMTLTGSSLVSNSSLHFVPIANPGTFPGVGKYFSAACTWLNGNVGPMYLAFVYEYAQWFCYGVDGSNSSNLVFPNGDYHAGDCIASKLTGTFHSTSPDTGAYTFHINL